ncbi:MAG TPA: ABC transporter substrate-binding protein [Burkholderiaceae bacterium]|nr:ABC transporter substrate-binding protein [Burkholderiaceae bacterium]
MRNRPVTRPFGVQADGSLDRRQFLATAGRLGAGLLGMGGAPLLFAQQNPVSIGWVRPSTGRLASSFAPLYVGGLIAVDEINAAGGILGRPIVRKEEDDEASPAKQPTVMKKIIDAGATALVGPTGSSQSLASLAFTGPAKLLQTTYAFAAEIGDGSRYPYHYQCSFNTDHQGEAAVRHLADTHKLKKIGILQENTAFGEQATTACKEALKRRGLSAVSIEVYPINAPDLNAYVGNLRRGGAEGVLAWIANIPNAAMAFNAMHSQKWYPMVAGHNGLFLDSLIDLVPAEAIRGASGTHYKSLTWTDKEAPGPRQQAFAKKLQSYPEAKGVETAVTMSPYYDFLHLLKFVIEQEKSFEPDKVKRALDNVKNYPGLLGPISFTPTNHTGIGPDEIAMGTLASARDPKAAGVFRERAK